jgi:glycosyltransferase involved in cell wall biosynthesis
MDKKIMKTEMDRAVSVVIPAYNEKNAVLEVIGKVREALTGCEHEIIVVNDGSSDGTAEVLANVREGVAVLSHKKNRGYGAALKTGIRAACFPNVLIIDADGSYPVEDIPRFMEHMNDNDMVVGARDLRINLRSPARWFIKKLASVLSGVNIPDLNSGMRMMRKEVVEKFIHLLPDKFSFTSTITVAFFSNGYDVAYIPIRYDKRVGQSKIRPVQDTINFIQLVLRMVLYFNPLKIFLPVSAVMILAGAGILFFRFITGERVMNVTTTVLTLSGFQIFAIGLLADLINKRLNK